MASSGPNSGSSAASVLIFAGDVAWSNATNALANDSSYATVTCTNTQESQALVVTGFGFSIPTGATINGILVEVKAHSDLSSGGSVYPYAVKAGDNTHYSWSSTSVAIGTTDQFYTLGGSSDLFNTTWSASDINASGFGIGLFFSPSFSGTLSIDYVRITVYYTPAPTVQTQTGKARVQATTLRTQAGTARLQKAALQTESGKSRITAQTLQTQTAIARITAATTQTISGVSRIRVTTNRTQGGVSRVTASANQSRAGISRITAATLQTQTGKAQVRATSLATITGVSRVRRSVNQPTTGLSRIRTTTNSTTTGKARILVLHQYSWASLSALPLDDANLANSYSSSQISDALVLDASYVDATGTGRFLVHVFKDLVTGTPATLGRSWRGRTIRPASASAVYLQIYNYNTATWETISFDNLSSSSPLTISGMVSGGIVNYLSPDNTTTWRVYQEIT